MEDLSLLVIYEVEAVIEEDEMSENTVEVSMKVEKDQLTEMTVVEMGQHMEQ